jgi:hypothetical protein
MIKVLDTSIVLVFSIAIISCNRKEKFSESDITHGIIISNLNVLLDSLEHFD